MDLFYIELANNFWAWNCPRLQLIYTVTLRYRKLIFPLPMDINYRQFLGQGWDLICTSSSQRWDPTCLEPVQVLCVLPQSLNSHMHRSCCVWRTPSLGSSIASDSYILPVSSSAQIPEPGDNCLGLSAQKSLSLSLCSQKGCLERCRGILVCTKRQSPQGMEEGQGSISKCQAEL